MALQKKILSTAYTTLFRQIRESKEAPPVDSMVDRFLDPYYNYSNTAQDHSGDYLGASNIALAKSPLKVGFNSQGGAEQSLKTGLQAYWMSAQFQTLVPLPAMSQEISSVVTAVNPSLLDGIFGNLYDDPAEAANNIADQLHLFTQSVQILITGLATAGSPPPVITVAGQIM